MVDATSPSADKNSPEVTANGKTVCFQQQDKTLLNCLEKNDIEVHYHCRDGFCGACRVKLNKGQVLYPQGEPLAFVGDDEILPCCCIPITNIDITVE
ncbi:class I ribonucleotide reductase maintenance protein YfaE [Thalassotalea marina]|uniref:(2Fe-2S) ferredoxin n=1 Tax=Thalassotalea marina TaxID=1673741 RepID=A0A919EL85_9GAMM|nr:class I ribonucleotide reductase maintenance protein YfaE [Thalassotalea marina]GHF93289.1 (2Fe-2S) ferredoxin [Thalassotalea marina]